MSFNSLNFNIYQHKSTSFNTCISAPFNTARMSFIMIWLILNSTSFNQNETYFFGLQAGPSAEQAADASAYCLFYCRKCRVMSLMTSRNQSPSFRVALESSSPPSRSLPSWPLSFSSADLASSPARPASIKFDKIEIELTHGLGNVFGLVKTKFE